MSYNLAPLFATTQSVPFPCRLFATTQSVPFPCRSLPRGVVGGGGGEGGGGGRARLQHKLWHCGAAVTRCGGGGREGLEGGLMLVMSIQSTNLISKKCSLELRKLVNSRNCYGTAQISYIKCLLPSPPPPHPSKQMKTDKTRNSILSVDRTPI